MKKTENSTLCPFCKGINNCAVNNKNSCWCTTATIPNELSAMVPIPLLHKSCICVTCVDLFNKNPEHFKSQYMLTESVSYI